LIFTFKLTIESEIGGESRKVCEHLPVVVFELEAWPEPKALSRVELKLLMKNFRSTIKVAKHIGASQAFVWAKIQKNSESDYG
jgi:hypothetical protein